MAYVLWTRFMRYNPKNPKWKTAIGLSCPQATLYVALRAVYLTGINFP